MSALVSFISFFALIFCVCACSKKGKYTPEKSAARTREDIDSMTIPQLKALCEDYSISIGQKASKNELKERIYKFFKC